MSGRGEEVQGAGGEGGGERRVEFEGVEGTDGPDKGELDEMHDRVVTRFEPPSLSNARARGCRDGEGEGDGSPQEISSDGVVAKRRRDTNIGAACAEGKGAGVADSKGVIVGESEVDRVGSSKGVIVGESEVDRVADSKGLRKALEGLLVEGGNFVGKFIMGAGSERIVAVARPHFARVKLYRPQVPAT